MGDCPGAGSGDWRDYEQRSLEEQRDDRIREARLWISRRRFEIVRIGTPQDGEHFVNYKIKEDCGFHWFVPDGHYVKNSDRKILKAEYEQLYGSTKMIPLNFDGNYIYYVVKRKKVKENP